MKLPAAYDAQRATSKAIMVPIPLLSDMKSPKKPKTSMGSNP